MTRKRKKKKFEKKKRQVPKQRFPAYLSKVKFREKEKDSQSDFPDSEFPRHRTSDGKAMLLCAIQISRGETKRGIFFSFFSRDIVGGNNGVSTEGPKEKVSIDIASFKVYMPSQEYLHCLN